MALNVLERRDAVGQIFQVDLLNNALTVWLRTTKFGRITLLGGQPRPYRKGRCSSAPKFLGFLLLLPARRRPQGLMVIGVFLCVCVSVCLCALFLSARYLKNGFMDHHQIWWVGPGGESVEEIQFWCWSDSGCVSRITFPFPLTLRDRAFCDI